MEPSPHDQLIAALRASIAQSGAGPGAGHPCSYLPGRESRELAFRVNQLEPGLYHALMDLNFRRSGRCVYRPQCAACRECRQIRVPVAEFRPNRSQRRCWRRGAALEVECRPPVLTREKYELYRRYLRARHDRQMSNSWASLENFLYDSPVRTLELTYRLEGRLVAVGIVDVEPAAFSTVYCYYDPDLAARSPGTFNILWTLDLARRKGVPYAYLGYYIRDCAKMNYKLNYRPCELLRQDGTWERCE